MQNVTNRFGFILALFISISLIIACGGKKDEVKEEKKETKKEETTREETKSNEDSRKETTTDRQETSTNERKSGGAQLYFCEDYVNGKEIGVSNRFTPGWLTVMVDLRPAGETLGTGKVELRITQVADAAGNSISEKIISTIPFNVQADWDYTYFQDKSKLKFSRPGTYKVTLQKVDGTPIVSGEVDVISK